MASPDYSKMAAAFLDLWQEQMARSLTDGDFVANMMQMLKQAAPTAATGRTRGAREQTDRHSAPASGIEPDEFYDLRQRVAACERRIRQLEAREQPAAAPVKQTEAPLNKAKPKGADAQRGTRPPAKASGNPQPKPVKRAVKRAIKRSPRKK